MLVDYLVRDGCKYCCVKFVLFTSDSSTKELLYNLSYSPKINGQNFLFTDTVYKEHHQVSNVEETANLTFRPSSVNFLLTRL